MSGRGDGGYVYSFVDKHGNWCQVKDEDYIDISADTRDLRTARITATTIAIDSTDPSTDDSDISRFCEEYAEKLQQKHDRKMRASQSKQRCQWSSGQSKRYSRKRSPFKVETDRDRRNTQKRDRQQSYRHWQNQRRWKTRERYESENDFSSISSLGEVPAIQTVAAGLIGTGNLSMSPVSSDSDATRENMKFDGSRDSQKTDAADVQFDNGHDSQQSDAVYEVSLVFCSVSLCLCVSVKDCLSECLVE